MALMYPRVKPGDTSISARLLNDIARHLERTGGTDAPFRATVIHATNDTGGDLGEAANVVALVPEDAGVSPTLDAPGCCSAIAPDGSHPIAFMPPCRDGETVPAVASGEIVVTVLMNAEGDAKADAITGDTTKLSSGTSGAFDILSVGAGTGEKLALVRYSGSGGATASTGGRFQIDLYQYVNMGSSSALRENILSPASWDVGYIQQCGSYPAIAIAQGPVSIDVSGYGTGSAIPTRSNNLGYCMITATNQDGTRDYSFRPKNEDSLVALTIVPQRECTFSAPNDIVFAWSKPVYPHRTYNNTVTGWGTEVIGSFDGLTGLSSSNSYSVPNTERQMLWVKAIVSGSNGAAYLYKHPRMSESDLVGHTESAAKASYPSVIADNSSGLGGTLYIGRYAESRDCIIYCKEAIAGNYYVIYGGISFAEYSCGDISHPLQTTYDLLDEADLNPTIPDMPTTVEPYGEWLLGQWCGYVWADYIKTNDDTPVALDRNVNYGGLLIEANCYQRYAYNSEATYNHDWFITRKQNPVENGGYGWAIADCNIATPSAMYLETSGVTVDWFDLSQFVLPQTGQYEYSYISETSTSYRAVIFMYGFQPTTAKIAYFPKIDVTVDGVTVQYPMAYTKQPAKTIQVANGYYQLDSYPQLWVFEFNKTTSTSTIHSIPIGGYNKAAVNYCYAFYPFAYTLNAYYDCTASEWVVTKTMTAYSNQVAQDWTENTDHTFTRIRLNDFNEGNLPTPPECRYKYTCTYDCMSTAWGDVTFMDVDSRRDITAWTDDGTGTGTYYCITNSDTPPDAPTITPSPIYYMWDAQYYCGYGWMIMPGWCSMSGTVSGWTLQYQDECSAWYTCVTTSATQPANPQTPDCSGCEWM